MAATAAANSVGVMVDLILREKDTRFTRLEEDVWHAAFPSKHCANSHNHKERRSLPWQNRMTSLLLLLLMLSCCTALSHDRSGMVRGMVRGQASSRSRQKSLAARLPRRAKMENDPPMEKNTHNKNNDIISFSTQSPVLSPQTESPGSAETSAAQVTTTTRPTSPAPTTKPPSLEPSTAPGKEKDVVNSKKKETPSPRNSSPTEASSVKPTLLPGKEKLADGTQSPTPHIDTVSTSKVSVQFSLWFPFGIVAGNSRMPTNSIRRGVLAALNQFLCTAFTDFALVVATDPGGGEEDVCARMIPGSSPLISLGEGGRLRRRRRLQRGTVLRDDPYVDLTVIKDSNLTWSIWVVSYLVQSVSDSMFEEALQHDPPSLKADRASSSMNETAISPLQHAIQSVLDINIREKVFDEILAQHVAGNMTVYSSVVGREVEVFGTLAAIHNDTVATGPQETTATSQQQQGAISGAQFDLLRWIGLAMLITTILSYTLLLRLARKRRMKQEWLERSRETTASAAQGDQDRHSQRSSISIASSLSKMGSQPSSPEVMDCFLERSAQTPSMTLLYPTTGDETEMARTNKMPQLTGSLPKQASRSKDSGDAAPCIPLPESLRIQ